ncbi:hypothetical protein G5714_019164 [Onychostoma macrolepis]|uniref:Immunoglobulin V-set domain-containing protein n=1 Tax=Onychostoma macrolepis TaxID=369639 RepID=A0A7J6C120_9TELE|nr:hypothetical protein G5714_019164 [Onychostoma macrolepis]
MKTPRTLPQTFFAMFKNVNLLLLLCLFNYSDEISVKKGEELKLDVQLSNAYKVVHWTKRGTERKEDWNKSHGVRSDRMTIRDGNLIINNFTATDAGTYEVLDTEGEILIMVTVTESKDKINYFNDDIQQHTSPLPPEVYWIVLVELFVLLILYAENVSRYVV